MKLVKSLLLGSAAGICAVSGVQAADLPMRKAAPVEYVRVCTAFGAGFFFIPGTDTCIRVGGRARFEYQYTQQNARQAAGVSGYRAIGRVALDARTQTAFGALRTFVRIDITSRTGGYLKSGSAERLANAFTATGQDTVNNAQRGVELDRAFIQLGGLIAGRAPSLFDLYSGDVELIGAGIYSSTSTNLLAYTASFGGGFSAILSIEDPTQRRHPVFANVNAGTTGLAAGTAPAAQNGVNFQTGAIPFAFVGANFNAAGVPQAAFALDVAQRNHVPDIVGALRYDGGFGSAQLSAAVHEIRVGNYAGVGGAGTGGATAALAPFSVNGGPALPVAVSPRVPDSAYGFAVQGGVKFNLPMIAPGDQLFLQAAYGQGAGSFTGVFNPPGFDTATAGITNRFVINQLDAVVDGRGRLNLTESFSVSAAFLHYWTPEIRQAVFGSYGNVNYDGRLRNANFGPAGISSTTAGGVTTVAGTVNPFNTTFKDYEIFYGGSNVIWSPVRDLDIGVEVVYQRIQVAGRVADANKGGTAAASGIGVGGTGRTTSFDDNILTRLRIQRDF